MVSSSHKGNCFPKNHVAAVNDNDDPAIRHVQMMMMLMMTIVDDDATMME